MATVKPITPADVHVQISKTAPDGVLEAWNEIIAENFDGGTSHFKQEDIINRIMLKLVGTGFTRSDIFERGWLNMEPVFEEAGWSVDYDKPGFNESFAASFTFRTRE